MRNAALGWLAGLVALGGCSTSDATPQSSSSSGAVPPNDAAPAAPDASSGDAAPPPPRDAGDAGATADADAAADASDGGRDFSTDPLKFGGPTRCAQAGVLLCEDFESGVLDTGTWTVVGDTPVVDGLQTMRGNKALHVTVTGNGGSYIRESKTFPAKNDTYFGRVFVRFKSLPAAPLGYAHWTFIAATGTGVSGEIRVSGQFFNGANFFGVGTDNRVDASGTGDWTQSDDDPHGAPEPVPTNAWTCIEWMHKGDTSETRFYWNGVEHPSLYTSKTSNGGNGQPYILPQFTDVWIGWEEYQSTSEPFEMWFDEIALDGSRIGCVL